MSSCRWGILGTANIARKNWKAIWNAENAELVAVASRTSERAEAFVAQCQAEVPYRAVPRAYGSYEELLADSSVDAVYIPLPTALRKQWVLRAAAAGKHVICEKPCAASAEDVAEMVDACREARVQFMDGVMFMHSRRLARLAEILADEQTVGPLKRIATHHAFRGPEAFFAQDIRLNHDLEPAGCLGDLGWYNIRVILWALGGQMPEEVSGSVLSQWQRADSPAPVPTEFSAELRFPGGVTASFYCSFLTANQQWVNFGGERGYLRVDDFVLPFHGSELEYTTVNAVYEMQSCDFTMQPRRRTQWVPEFSQSAPDAQETNMFRNFSAAVLSGKLNLQWPELALATQRVMDACLQSAGG